MAEWWQAFQRPSAPPKGAGTAAPVVLNPIQQRAQQVLDFLMGGLLGAGDEEVRRRDPAAWGELALSMAPLMGGIKAVKGAKAVKAAKVATLADADDAARGIRAYHGSPHDFDAFDLAKLGTGEGGRSQGVGINVTADPTYAEAYRDPGPLAGTGRGRGHVYEVNIKAKPEEMLAWDKPVREQAVAAKLKGLPQSGLPNDGDPLGNARWVVKDGRYFLRTAEGTQFPMSARDLDQLYGLDPKNLTGANVYNRLTLALKGDEAAASRLLAERGIAGNQYSYRGAENYVVYDPQRLEILRKYGLLAPLAGAAMYEQQRQQTPNPLARVMTH